MQKDGPRVHTICPASAHNVPDMTNDPHKAPATPTLSQQELKALQGAEPPRMHPKTREAIQLLVRTGMTQRWCAEQVGMNENALGRALKKPHIATWFEKQKILAMQDLKQLRKLGEIAAINTGLDLMQNATSEAVRARMVEFFGGGGAGKPSTIVNVQQNNGSTGYEMAKPGQRVVDIIDSNAPDADPQTGSQQHDSDESQ